MAVPRLGVFIAPKAVGRLFQFHDYTRCPDFKKGGRLPERVLYPILRPSVMHSPRYYHLQQAVRLKRKYREDQKNNYSKRKVCIWCICKLIVYFMSSTYNLKVYDSPTLYFLAHSSLILESSSASFGKSFGET